MLAGLLGLVSKMPQFEGVIEQLRSRKPAAVSVLQAAKPLVLGGLWHELDVPTVIVTPQPDGARKLYDQLVAYWDQERAIYHFAELEALPFERITPDTATVHERIDALAALTGIGGERRPPLVVTSAAGVALKTLRPEAFRAGDHQVVRRGDTVSLGAMLTRWAELGYRTERIAEVPGTMSRRGGIVDVYPPSSAYPARLDFWGDYLESIRLYDPGTQRSLERVEEVVVPPAHELLPMAGDQQRVERVINRLDPSTCSRKEGDRITEEISLLLGGNEVEDASFYTGIFNHSSLLDFLGDDTLLLLDRPAEVEEAVRELEVRAREMYETKAQRGELPRNFPSPYLSWTEVSDRLPADGRRLEVTPWGGDEHASFPFLQAPSFRGQVESFMADVEERCQRRERILVVSNHAQRLRDLFQERGIGAVVREELVELPSAGTVTVVRGSAPEGWVVSAETRLALFTDSEIFGTAKVSRSRRKFAPSPPSLPAEITPGAYVVHVDHGVARFSGTVTMSDTGEEREYLVLEYAEDDRLYVPMELSYRVGLYLAPNDQPPSLTRLGGQDWVNTKSRVKRAAREMAEELLGLYARREASDGIAFGADTPWQLELEDAFPYVETADQFRAIDSVKTDMEDRRSMDRLVCGDVGYGKTEVALRAAFKAVAYGYQVAVLVPTTVLAQQHYATFTERLSPYPVRVEVLSRFRSEEEQQDVLEGMARGTVDICIGTHRLIQKDVKFKNLGLVVVDEEHRFGVAHKERLKQMRAEVDVLTLTATPIPRTLNMALSGVRDMSTMETPPEERLPIKTYVSEDSDDLIREAILRELDRGGQVYFVHNRIHNITQIADRLNRLVPEARVAIGHGRIPEEQLENVMAGFSQGEHDVLLCTTIIESGLDLPNVNTLIIDRADTFGLAQLYQLRGRVGRGRNRAYAHMLVPRGRRITETAQKRLETVLAATELGAGFRIAMKDLEIRGAGQILGSQQSGNIQAVGFDLYSQLLASAVDEIKSGQETPPEPREQAEEEHQDEIVVNLKMPARILPAYVEDLPTRLSFYQRLSHAGDLTEVRDVQDELWDRFGAFPRELHNLLYTVRVRVLARAAGVESVLKEGSVVAVRLREDVGGARDPLQRALGPGVRVGNRLLRLDTSQGEAPWGQALLELLEGLARFREQMVEMVRA